MDLVTPLKKKQHSPADPPRLLSYHCCGVTTFASPPLGHFSLSPFHVNWWLRRDAATAAVLSERRDAHCARRRDASTVATAVPHPRTLFPFNLGEDPGLIRCMEYTAPDGGTVVVSEKQGVGFLVVGKICKKYTLLRLRLSIIENSLHSDVSCDL